MWPGKRSTAEPTERKLKADTRAAAGGRICSMNWPKITVVTPTHNQGQFPEETILSMASIYRRHAGAAYETLFLNCRSHRARIQFVRRWVRRFRLI
jgi:hypothetical protein